MYSHLILNPRAVDSQDQKYKTEICLFYHDVPHVIRVQLAYSQVRSFCAYI